MAQTKTITVQMSQEQFDELEMLARKQGITMAGMFRQALDLNRLIVDAKTDGKTEILFKRGDSIQELKLAS